MFWVWLLVVTCVLVAVVLLTLGRLDGLPAAEPDDVELDLPVDREVRGDDVLGVRLPVALRGYRMQPVDELLDRLAAELADRDRRIEMLEAEREGAGRHGQVPGAER